MCSAALQTAAVPDLQERLQEDSQEPRSDVAARHGRRLPSGCRARCFTSVEALLKLPRLPELVSESIARVVRSVLRPVVWELAQRRRREAGAARRLRVRAARPSRIAPTRGGRARRARRRRERARHRAAHQHLRSGERASSSCAAQASVSAGIPDFRTPGTGLYDNLQKYSLPRPEQSSSSRTSKSARGVLRARARLAPAASGRRRRTTSSRSSSASACCGASSRRTSTRSSARRACRRARRRARLVRVVPLYRVPARALDRVVQGRARRPRAVARCDACGGLVKPDIVFYGEMLPDRFRGAAPTCRARSCSS